MKAALAGYDGATDGAAVFSGLSISLWDWESGAG